MLLQADWLLQRLESSQLQTALSKLKSGSMQLCQEAKSLPPEVNGQPDFKAKTQMIIQCAYNIAKAAKTLVTSIQAATGTD